MHCDIDLGKLSISDDQSLAATSVHWVGSTAASRTEQPSAQLKYKKHEDCKHNLGQCNYE